MAISNTMFVVRTTSCLPVLISNVYSRFSVMATYLAQVVGLAFFCLLAIAFVGGQDYFVTK